MFATMSLVTSIKDYIEVVHKLIETDPNFKMTTYYDFGSILTFIILSGKDFIGSFLSFQWFHSFWSIPTRIPDIASALISEISVFDGSFQNTQTVLESPISYGNHNFFIYCSEKFMIGLLNSVFLCLPTSIAHVITLRRFVMQGLEAGFISGLGAIAGNIVWIGSIVFGLRFVIIPWLSFDLFRCFLGFVLIVKYMWDSYSERRMVLEDLSKYKIFFLTFLLSFTEQTTLYPFISNLSFGSDATILESFPTENFYEFGFVHASYLLGILIGSLSLLQFTCWFWENPAFQIYMWFISSFKITTSVYSKFVNLTFLYLTMICAISNIAYFGLDYTLTNPLGFVHEDRLFDQKALLETAFINTKASDRNTRRNRGRHGRRERWKRRVRRYRTFDASLYDQGVYDLLTLEDLNYGFDRFWLRRKIRNHRVRFRFFPGPWMRSFKKQLSRPRLESFMGPRVEFFRILFEQAYHPEFHEFSTKKNILKTSQTQSQNEFQMPFFGGQKKESTPNSNEFSVQTLKNTNSIYWNPIGNKKERLLKENSTLRKFVRKVNNRIKIAKIQNQIENPQNLEIALENSQKLTQQISSKAWKSFSALENTTFNSTSANSSQSPSSSMFKKSEQNLLFQRFYKKMFMPVSEGEKNQKVFGFTPFQNENSSVFGAKKKSFFPSQKESFDNDFHLSKKDRFLERYKSFLRAPLEKSENFIDSLNEKNNTNRVELEKNSIVFPLTSESSSNAVSKEKNSSSPFSLEKKKVEPKSNFRALQYESQYRSMTLLHPLKFYFQKEEALKRKFKFYGVKLFRNFGVENNAPYFRVMMKRFFYHYKPTLRWERTLRVATMRRARRKSSRIPRKLNVPKTSQILATTINNSDPQKPVKILRDQSSLNQSVVTKPTHFYSLVEKRASRYRYQIYKDVLQHWYYSPLNRFLLKLDVDSFIRRQPNSYFLTKADEKLLHLKRQLLSEYYETLRWYTYMQHYSTMKNQIGGTKSLSSRAYNQQFVGTFKKIRHLFNITPSFNENTVLKFDQPLYNEYKNSQNLSIFHESIIHEELLADDLFFFDSSNKKNNKKNKNSFGGAVDFQNSSRFPEDLTNQSARILREYLAEAAPVRQDYIQSLLKDKNYWELTKFLFRGQKIRGTNPVTNETDFLNQEKNYLLTPNFETNKFETNKRNEEMWLTLLKKCQNKLYDQEALKNYVALKKEKYESKKQKHEKYLKNRLERMKESFLLRAQASKMNENIQETSFKTNEKRRNENVFEFYNFSGYTSSIQKAMKESILWERNSLSSSSFQTLEKFFAKKNFLQKTNIRNNRPNIYFSLNKQNNQSQKSEEELKISNVVNPQKAQSLLFRTTLNNSFKKRAVEIVEAENLFKQKVAKNSKKLFGEDKKQLQKKSFVFDSQPISSFKKFFWKTVRFKNILSSTKKEETAQPTSQQSPKLLAKVPSLSQLFSFAKYGTSEISNKNLDFWKKRENALSKRRKIRKTLKRLRNQNTATEKIVFENRDFSKTNKLSRTETPSRQKSDQNIEKNQDRFESFRSLQKKQHEAFNKQEDTRSESWKKYYSFKSNGTKDAAENYSGEHKSFFQKLIAFPRTAFEEGRQNLFTKKFQRRRSRLRRYSSFKGRGPIKKRTLREKFKRQFKSLKKYGANQENSTSAQIQMEREKKKAELIQLITQRSAELRPQVDQNEKFVKRDQKQRRTRQMKHRVWKKKKQNFAQKRRKLRKRRRSTISKIRVFNKKLQRILSKKEIQTWWWQTFFPNFQKTTEKTWQMQKNMQIRKQLFELSEKEILERDEMKSSNISVFSSQNANEEKNKDSQNSYNFLQIGDKDYKPFAIPEALRIREKLIQKEILRFNNSAMKNSSNGKLQDESLENSKTLNLSTTEQSKQMKNKNLSVIDGNQQASQNLQRTSDLLEKFTENSSFGFATQNQSTNAQMNEKFFVGTNPIPFYAGWDESLRKFVLTNRLLSRKDCFSSSKGMATFFNARQNEKTNSNIVQEFSKAPLQGMNAATTLYWQIPFTTYDPDQFFALGMDGFSPLGWRNFSFKHSKQTTKPILVKNFFSFLGSSNEKSSAPGSKTASKNLSKNLQFKFLENTLKTKMFDPSTCTTSEKCLNLNEFNKINNIGFSNEFFLSKTEIDKNFEYRRILKKQKRIKKHPRPPVWFPSGSLSQQVLPVHYIYVFYKRSRLPRDRYIRRRLRSTFLKQNSNESSFNTSTITKITDFTLRKRTKPRRKYHRKRFLLDTNNFLLRRRKFRSMLDENEALRPSSKLFDTSLKQEKRNLKAKQRRKMTDSKQSNENLRVRQLRRRVQRQVFRPVWRYRPRSGGFVWPGDYLRLELVKAPQLNSTLSFTSGKTPEVSPQETSTRKIRKKKRRALQEWQIQPKKYLLEKHNLKVLKKRVEKSIQTLRF
uniref:Hypothetical chloroplast RF1 n=1 Tax=Pectinodesmus pectinatus TaxID=91197 RepID=A0A2H4FD37_9CHLO|nr:hypothetical chloroplast RF1 [Pectinodesmus pectinatus]AOS53116.1 hypothetical chloroplast RF1 [Pectinodesmus pectinatus]